MGERPYVTDVNYFSNKIKFMQYKYNNHKIILLRGLLKV